MKNVIAKIAMVAVAFISLNASATSPVDPNGLPVIELRMGGGMPVPGGLSSRAITVYRNGEVIVRETRLPKDFGSNEKPETIEYLLANMEARDMLEIGEAVQSLKGGPLVRPNQPACMDAPGYQYTVYKYNAPVVVYRVSMCRHEQLKDRSQRPAAAAIKSFLDQLNKLAH